MRIKESIIRSNKLETTTCRTENYLERPVVKDMRLVNKYVTTD